MRIALGIEYDGSAYNGWQRQKTGVGVQELVERTISTVANHNVELVCAGRTDTGVHASGQVAHFDTSSERSPRGWLLGANSLLPDDISVCWVRPVGDDFHARFSATARTYRYLILNRLERSALFRQRAWWVYDNLDTANMRQAAAELLGEHDFSAFRAAACQASTATRDLQLLEVRRWGDWIGVTVRANAFLQHMVRNIVGLLVEVGRGDHLPSRAREVLDSRDRTAGGVAAPPHGLSLVAVDYPAAFDLPTVTIADVLPGFGA
jgi:tRNA pseudouridine38-40 synthase